MSSSATRSKARAKHYGYTEPRLWTKPLRELTEETTHGFAVIEFAATMLGVHLYPWQKWLLIHALELNGDGTYRFRKVFVLVGRQNGKTTLLVVLTLWWLFMDADSFPEHLPPHEFLVLGTAQNLDIAEEAWDEALKRCDPEPDEDDAHLAVSWLQAETRKPIKTNGKKALRLKNGAKYQARAATRAAGRGKSAARVVMDEMREQQTWDVWGSVSKTKNAMFNSQLWGISSAGDAKSIVLATLRQGLLAAIAEWETYVESGLKSIEEYANTHDLDSALFEWSAPEGSRLLDVEGVLQSNPSVGHKPMFFEAIMSDLKGSEPEATKRTEILCQWVTAMLDVYLDGPSFDGCADGPDKKARGGSVIAEGSRMVVGLDVSHDRQMSYVAIGGYRDDEFQHGEVILRRAGMLWVPKYVKELCARHGITDVAVQARGCPAAEFVEPLREAGLNVFEVSGTHLGASTGRMGDRTRDRSWRHRNQPALNMAAAGAVTKKLGEVRVWDRAASAVDIAPMVAVSNALYALETIPPPAPITSAYDDHDLVVI